MIGLRHGKGIFLIILLLNSLLLSAVSYASIVVTGTRIIYPAEAREVSVKLNNDGSTPALVQSWIDNGDPKATPDTASSPFVLTPPITRIDSQKGQTLRVRFVGEDSLPQDKESLFWLNVLELPPSVDDGKNKLKIAFRTRLKLLYRPKNLAGDVASAGKGIEWRVVRNGSSYQLDGYNPGAYYISLNHIRVGGQTISLDINNGIIPPKQHQSFKIDGGISGGTKIKFTTINDYGAATEWESALRN